LQTDYIDLYYAHADDPDTPLDETLSTFDELITEGKVRYIAASNYTASRLERALETSDHHGLARYVALQPQYSLIERDHFEGPLAEVCEREDLACVPYWALARGFLTGKYRPDGPTVDSPRAGQAAQYLDDRGIRVLAALDRVATAQHTTVPAVALAWVLAQPSVAAPIASARNPGQLAEILPAAKLELDPEALRELSDASAEPATT
jgi:aryl-alcohol dehydrogenase-like predicted oxidoreductase